MSRDVSLAAMMRAARASAAEQSKRARAVGVGELRDFVSGEPGTLEDRMHQLRRARGAYEDAITAAESDAELAPLKLLDEVRGLREQMQQMLEREREDTLEPKAESAGASVEPVVPLEERPPEAAALLPPERIKTISPAMPLAAAPMKLRVQIGERDPSGMIRRFRFSDQSGKSIDGRVAERDGNGMIKSVEWSAA